MTTAIIALAAFGGGVLAALLGWADSEQPFVFRKFFASLLRAVIAALLFAAAYQLRDGLGALDVVWAILGGAGVDVLGNRGAGIVLNALKPPTPPTP